MKTDELFYEVFRMDPRSLFELARLDIRGEYEFESITIKTTEKRLDGFFRRTDGIGPNVFLEAQGYPDALIYWRTFREICTWYEQTASPLSFVAIILFVDRKYDPGSPPLDCVSPNRLIRIYLPDALKALGERPSVLTVLKPLVLPDKKNLNQNVCRFDAEIKAMNLSQSKVNLLKELLEYSILQRFPEITLKEIRKMIQLTPLEKTVAGQELIQMGIEKGFGTGFGTGLGKGKLMGEIRMAQRFLKIPLISEEQLLTLSLDELKAILNGLASQLP